MTRRSWAALFPLLIAWGCGGSSGPPLVPIEGTVTFDGQPLANANVQLIPQGQNLGQTGFAKTDATGKFAIGTADGKTKGAAAGEYKVVISKHVKPDGSDYIARPDEDPMLANYKELLPAVYSNPEQSKLNTNIPAEGKQDLSFQLTKSGSGS
jgi:hypothetical protein